MSIGSIDTNNMSIASMTSVGGQNAPSSIPPPMQSGPAATADVSKEGQFLGKLQQLSTQNPAEFKQITSEISGQLKAEAGNATGSQAQFLNSLADKFGAASQSGDASQLSPQNGGAVAGHRHHHGGHHHGGGGASAMGSATGSTSATGAAGATGATGSSAQSSIASIFQNAMSEVDSALDGDSSSTMAAGGTAT